MQKTSTADLARDWIELRDVLRELGRSHSLRDPIAMALEEQQLTPTQVHCLLWLGVDGELTMGEIATRLGVTEKTITGLIDRLENDGHVQRIRSEKDRRIVHVRLTPKGSGIYHRCDAALEKKITHLLSLLDQPERRALISIMKKLADGGAPDRDKRGTHG